MADVLTIDLLREILREMAATLAAQAAYLTELDEAIGDGDHGWNMALGFQKVCEQLELTTNATPDLLLRTTGMTLVTSISGASGPLYGAAFIAAGMAVQGQTSLTLSDLARLGQAASEALARRGRCRLGDKTILDALQPAVLALSEAAERGCNLEEGLAAAAEAARQGMAASVPLVARRGLAMQYGAASAGHQDPGATSCYLLFDAAWRTVKRWGR